MFSATAGLSAAAKNTLKSYGGWTAFLRSYNHKPENNDDAKEGKAILEALARNGEKEKK